MSQKVLRVQSYLAVGKDYKRWRLWTCVEGKDRHAKVLEEIKQLENQGHKAKVWAPRPEHAISGHLHIVVLATFRELCKLAGIEDRIKEK